MENFEFLTKYFHLQYGIMFDKLIDLEFALIGYSEGDSHYFWNNALINKVLSREQLMTVEKQLKELGRIPAYYFENSKNTESLARQLEKNAFKKSAEDSWMFWNGGEIDTTHFESIRKVATLADLEIFLNTFDRWYDEGDPQNPYGKLGDYLKVAKTVWERHEGTNRLEYFVVYKSDTPVAVSTLTSHAGLGYISNVGSLRNVRGEGYGKAATLYCVKQSLERNNTQCCLATEEGMYPNEFYKRIGFPTRFSSLVFTKGA